MGANTRYYRSIEWAPNPFDMLFVENPSPLRPNGSKIKYIFLIPWPFCTITAFPYLKDSELELSILISENFNFQKERICAN